MKNRDFKIIAAASIIIGSVLSILDRIFSQPYLTFGKSPYPDLLRDIGWFLLIVPPLIYIWLDRYNLFPDWFKREGNSQYE
jgi:hypothetical protein